MGDDTRSGAAAPRDPWYFRRWTFEARTGNPTRKAVLAALGSMADTNTGRCEAKVDTIATWTELGERTVRNALRGLEESGLIASRPQWRYDGGRRGSEFLLRAPGVTEWPDGTPLPSSPPAPDAGGPPPARGAGAPPAGGAGQEQPPRNGHVPDGEESAGAREPKPDPRSKLPDGFPEHLLPHARAVYRILHAVAEQHPTAGPVWPLSVGKAIASHPRHPLVGVAHELDGWAVDPPRPIRDVVGTYRTFLSKRRELASTEALADDGTPTNAPRSAPAGVTPIRRAQSAGERLEERTAIRRARFEAAGGKL